jgi:hypothetical protein
VPVSAAPVRVQYGPDARDYAWYEPDLSKAEREAFVSERMPEGELFVWEGKIASQMENDFTKPTVGQFLPGGVPQLLINFRMPERAAAQKAAKPPPRQPTNWVDMDVNVPNESVTVQHLGSYEVTPKRTGTAAASAAHGAQASNNESSP